MKRFFTLMAVSLLLLGGAAQADEREEMQVLQAEIRQAQHDLELLQVEAVKTEDPAKRQVLDEKIVEHQIRLVGMRDKLEMLGMERALHAKEILEEGEVTYHRAKQAYEKATEAGDALRMSLLMLKREGKEAEIDRVENEARNVEAAVSRYRRAMDLIEEARARAKAGRIEAAREAIEMARNALETIDIHVEIEQECHPTADGEFVLDLKATQTALNERRRKLKVLEERIAEALKRYTEAHPQVVELRRQARELRRRLTEFHPGPPLALEKVDVDRYRSISKSALKAESDFHELTGYAGRRNAADAAAYVRLGHLRKAMHHLREAGDHEGADRIAQEIREIEEHLERERAEAHGPEHEGVHPRVLEAIEGLRREIRELRAEVRELKEILRNHPAR